MQHAMRRADKLMPQSRVHELLAAGYCARLGTVGADGWPYVCPLLYVWRDGKLWFHNTAVEGHFQRNVRHDARACFELDVPGEVFAYGRFACDTGIEYQSIVAFGRITIETDPSAKVAFFQALMAKYYGADPSRPKDFFPRLDAITLYAMALERVVGKETALPAPDARWPAVDKTKSPSATPPRDT
jgi:uncharacterized protein